jgi:hypothetical protein
VIAIVIVAAGADPTAAARTVSASKTNFFMISNTPNGEFVF